MRAAWTTTDETGGHFACAGTAYGAGTIVDRAIVLSADDQVTVVTGSAEQLVAWTRRLYLDALRAADRADEATLLQELHQRAYDAEHAEGEIGAKRVVDLYGVSVSAVPTEGGLVIHLNTEDLPGGHVPLSVEVDGYDAGTFRDPDQVPDLNVLWVLYEDGESDVIDMDAVVTELTELGIPAVVEQTGGNTATVYAGEPYNDGEGERYPVAAGPGHFEGPGWTQGRAYREEFSLGVNDDGLTDSHYPPAGATEADIARMIAHVLRGDPPLADLFGVETVPLYDPTAPVKQPRRYTFRYVDHINDLGKWCSWSMKTVRTGEIDDTALDAADAAYVLCPAMCRASVRIERVGL